MHSIRFRIRSRSGQWLFRGHSFLKRRRRPSADALVRMAGDRSGSLTGSARQAPSLGPLFRARPHPGRCAGTPKVCGHPSAPCAAASALRHWPPRRGGPLATDRRCSGASACRFASPLRRGPRPPAPLASGYRRLCPPVAPPPSRPPARLATPCGRLGRLRHSVLRLALGLLRVGLRPALRATAGSPPALLRRSLGGSPQDGPCSSWLVARSPRSATSAGLRAPLLPPGAWSGPAGRFLRPPAPGVFGRSSQGDKVCS